jgi:hypothetical protein
MKMNLHGLIRERCSMRSLRNIAVASILGVLLNSSCMYGPRIDGPYEGRVIDADTKEPIEGVVVLGVWYTTQFSPAGSTHNFYDARETVTDKKGEFTIRGMGLRVLSNLEPMYVVIFKSGYEHIGMWPWESLKEDKLLKEKIKWEGNKPIIPLRRWSLEERRNRLGSYYVDVVPEEKQRLLLKEIERERKEVDR